MRRATAILGVLGFAAFASAARAQSAMPDFSNPYGGVSAYLHDDAAVAPAPKPLKKLAVRKPAAKIARHSGTPQKEAQKPLRLDAVDAGLAPVDNMPRPVALVPASKAKQKDSALGFDMKWSASSDPIYNPATSTIPGVDQVKRSIGDPAVETGSGVEAGVNLKF